MPETANLTNAMNPIDLGEGRVVILPLGLIQTVQHWDTEPA